MLASDAPYYAITDDDGHLWIDAPAPGTYDAIAIAAGAAHRSIAVAARSTARIDIAVP